TWGTHWEKQKLSQKYGSREKFPHRYPDYFPQADADIEAWIYPMDALGEFRMWVQDEYLPHKLPAYIGRKVKAGALPASRAEIMLQKRRIPVLERATTTASFVPGIIVRKDADYASVTDQIRRLIIPERARASDVVIVTKTTVTKAPSHSAPPRPALLGLYASQPQSEEVAEFLAEKEEAADQDATAQSSSHPARETARLSAAEVTPESVSRVSSELETLRAVLRSVSQQSPHPLNLAQLSPSVLPGMPDVQSVSEDVELSPEVEIEPLPEMSALAVREFLTQERPKSTSLSSSAEQAAMPGSGESIAGLLQTLGAAEEEREEMPGKEKKAELAIVDRVVVAWERHPLVIAPGMVIILMGAPTIISLLGHGGWLTTILFVVAILASGGVMIAAFDRDRANG
ncbi:MAG: hypothetical protein M1283_02350, partial [Gammaproteobacteria bacterium]|nr:hypothetical protein [Gammaproteobacteria bacterium]